LNHDANGDGLLREGRNNPKKGNGKGGKEKDEKTLYFLEFRESLAQIACQLADIHLFLFVFARYDRDLKVLDKFSESNITEGLTFLLIPQFLGLLLCFGNFLRKIKLKLQKLIFLLL